MQNQMENARGRQFSSILRHPAVVTGRAARRRVGGFFLAPRRTVRSAMRRGRRRARPRSVAAAISTSTRVTLVRAEGSAAAARRLRGLCLLALGVIRWRRLIRVIARGRDSRVEQRCRGTAESRRGIEDSIRPLRPGPAGVERTLATGRIHAQTAAPSLSTATGVPALTRPAS